jgi:uncharacterized protein (UPF0218 family)
MQLDANDLQFLKKPFGTLIPEKDVTKKHVSTMLESTRPIFTVGDATTDRLISFGITPRVAVIDGIERRSKHYGSIHYHSKQMSCNNPPGTISKDAVDVLKNALNSPLPVKVMVHGEEDLLALPLISLAPQGSAVLYGQPLEGLVLVRIDSEKQRQAKALMSRIFGNENRTNIIQ